MANSTSFVTDEGIVMVDCGLVQVGPLIHQHVRSYTDEPLHTVVYTHGHLDHCTGLAPWLQEGHPRIVAHENVPRRFNRYLRTVGLQEHINKIQFGIEDMHLPTGFAFPDITYDDQLTLRVGGETFELHHGMGETDDATWVWAADRKILASGDFWISSVPNCGNPQKVQRYPEEWVTTFEQMIPLGAELLLPRARSHLQTPGLVRLYLVLQAEHLGNTGPAHDWFVRRAETVRSLIAHGLREARARGEIRSDVDVETKATEIVAFLDGAQFHYLLNPDAVDLVSLYEGYSAALIRDLTPPRHAAQ